MFGWLSPKPMEDEDAEVVENEATDHACSTDDEQPNRDQDSIVVAVRSVSGEYVFTWQWPDGSTGEGTPLSDDFKSCSFFCLRYKDGRPVKDIDTEAANASRSYACVREHGTQDMDKLISTMTCLTFAETEGSAIVVPIGKVIGYRWRLVTDEFVRQYNVMVGPGRLVEGECVPHKAYHKFVKTGKMD